MSFVLWLVSVWEEWKSFHSSPLSGASSREGVSVEELAVDVLSVLDAQKKNLLGIEKTEQHAPVACDAK